jgi:hypothetical protein
VADAILPTGGDSPQEYVQQCTGFFMMVQHPKFRAAWESPEHPAHAFARRTVSWMQAVIPTMVQAKEQGLAVFGPDVFSMDMDAMRAVTKELGLGSGILDSMKGIFGL